MSLSTKLVTPNILPTTKKKTLLQLPQFPLYRMAFSLLVLLLSLPNLSTSDPRISKAALICGTTKSSDGGSFIHNFVSDMESLSDLVSTQRFASHVSGNSTSSPVFGLAQCFSDLSLTDCLLCFAECRTKLPRCLPSSSARIFLDGCFLRYDSIPFFSDSVSPLDSAVCGPLSNSTPPFNAVLTSVNDPFRASVLGVIENVSSQAVKKGGFGSGVWPADGSGSAVNGTGGFPAVYALAQCWKTVSKKGCGMCLDKARAEVRRCLPAKEGRALNAGCYLRYSSEKFYNELEVEERVSDSGSTKPFTVLAIASSIVIMVFLMFLGAFLGYKRLSKGRKDRKHLIRLPTAFRKSSLNFKYVVLEKATDFFNQSRKLGEGGAGSVYKGVLPDGRVIAVKRLFFNTRQWVDEFFNEVNLISGMQHKNLVKLLGCSIEGPESLLVYEYMPNKSLDCFLFDKNKNQLLSWQKRLDIIVGTAEGLAYLHEGSKFRIIHRDIKTSNILLDESLTAKIADFGLARCFSADKTHLSTGIAGTLGYMAPEYLVRGQLTEKADVYSFGILVLEIVCGRKNSIYSQESDSILQTVWKNYKENTLPDSVDECLRNNFPAKEVSGVLQVGLLCTQASAALRPSMAEVVKMLTEKDCPIPLPMQPPFLNASVVDPDITTTPTKSSSILSLASPTDNPLTISISEPR